MKKDMTWKEAKSNLNITTEDQVYIELEEQLIDALIQLRESKGISQRELAELCDCKQSAIARLETMGHSPQIDSLLKILVPLGYKLAIVPIK